LKYSNDAKKKNLSAYKNKIKMEETSIQKVIRYLKNPNKAKKKLIGLLRGSFYIVFYRLTKRNVKIKFPFYAYTKVKIEGPGTVFIDKKCMAMQNVFKGLSIVTLNKDSKIRIGRNGLLGGTTIRCANTINIGEKLMTAISLIQDINFFTFDSRNTDSTYSFFINSKPITIGSNVWLVTQSTILGGSIIGDDSVVSAGALCYDNHVKEYNIVSGSPARRGISIDKLKNYRW